MFFFSNEYVYYFEVGLSEKIRHQWNNKLPTSSMTWDPWPHPTPPKRCPVMLGTVGHRSSLSTPFLNAANKTFALCPACHLRGKKPGSCWRSVVESMDRWMGFQAKNSPRKPECFETFDTWCRTCLTEKLSTKPQVFSNFLEKSVILPFHEV